MFTREVNMAQNIDIVNGCPYSFVKESEDLFLLTKLVEWMNLKVYGNRFNNQMMSVDFDNDYSILKFKVPFNNDGKDFSLGKLKDNIKSANLSRTDKIGFTILYLLLQAKSDKSSITIKYEFPEIEFGSRPIELAQDKVFDYSTLLPLGGKSYLNKSDANLTLGIKGGDCVIIEPDECVTGLFDRKGNCFKLLKSNVTNEYLQFSLKQNSKGTTSLLLDSECIDKAENDIHRNDKALKASNLIAHINEQDIKFDDVLSFTVIDDKMAVVFFSGEIKTYNWYSLLWNVDYYKQKYQKEYGKILYIVDDSTFVVQSIGEFKLK